MGNSAMMRMAIQKLLELPVKKDLIFQPSQLDFIHYKQSLYCSYVMYLGATRKSGTIRAGFSPSHGLVPKQLKKQHEAYIKSLKQYCSKRKMDPFSASVKTGVNFLAEWWCRIQCCYHMLYVLCQRGS